MGGASTAIHAGGVFNLAFAAFHVLFWRLFDWDRDLATLNAINRAVMQILNLCLTFIFLAFAYLSFEHAEELLGTRCSVSSPSSGCCVRSSRRSSSGSGTACRAHCSACSSWARRSTPIRPGSAALPEDRVGAGSGAGSDPLNPGEMRCIQARNRK